MRRDPERAPKPILAAAEKEFSAKGFAGARVDAIAKLARPPRLTSSNGSGTGQYRAVPGHPPLAALTIDWADVARFMLDAAEQSSHVRESVDLGR